MKKIKFILDQINRISTTAEKAVPLARKKKISLFIDVLKCYILYGANDEDYLGLELYKKSASERNSFITSGRNYKYLYNNHYTNEDKSIFLSKCEFNPQFSKFFNRRWMSTKGATLSEINDFMDSLDEVIVKPDLGLQGLGVYKIKKTDLKKREEFIRILPISNKDGKGENYVIEEVIKQHVDMAYFNESSVNTCRIETITDKSGKAHLLNTIVIMGGKGSVISNTHTGGVMAHVDPETGIVDSKGRNPEGFFFLSHPGTGALLPGRVIPFWHEVIELALKAAEERPTARCVGWDIAVTENGPDLIEGNIQFGHCTQACDMVGRWSLVKKLL